MINEQLLAYINQQIKSGESQAQIKSSLMANGWQEKLVDEAFSSLVLPSKPSAASSRSFPSESSKKKNKILLAVLVVIIGSLIISGGTFAYFNYFQSPEKVIQKALVNLSGIEFLTYAGEIKIELATKDLSFSGSAVPLAQDKEMSTFLIDFTGKSDVRELKEIKSLFLSNIKTNILPPEEFTSELELRIIDSAIYFKLRGAPNIGFFNLSSIENQWVKINIADLQTQFKAAEWLEANLTGQGLSLEQIEKIKSAIQQAKIIKRLSSEKIEGVSTYHYGFTIDKEKTKSLIVEISQIVQGRLLTEQEIKEIDQVLTTVNLTAGEIWIGKKDLLPRQISLNFEAKDPEKSETFSKISFVSSFNDFNELVQVDAPMQIKSLEEVLIGFLEGMLGPVSEGTLSPATPEGVDSNN
jgi:hypothetical protein